MKKPRNWLVLFQPVNEITVDTMKVIDAWSTTNGTFAGAVQTMKANMAEYRTKFGDGDVRVIESKLGWRLPMVSAS